MQPETVNTENGRFYLPELDGLRFFAFLAVFLSHVAVFSNGANEAKPAIIQIFNLVGRFGVDLFFALSAYLLTVLMIREKDRFGSLNVRAFYMRRLLRIWPLYFTWIAALSRFCEFWITNTIRNVTTLVQEFMTSCQVSEYAKIGPVRSHSTTVIAAAPNTPGCPETSAM